MREIKFRAWSTIEEPRMIELNRGLIEVDLVDSPKWKVMQYTGLKDKNDREIYCSDLIKTPAGTGEVIWEDGCYRIYWNHRDNTTLHDTKSEQMEVVGNKYEGLQNAGKGDII